MKESINFDRAAGFYDATRKLPGGEADAITKALLAEIRTTGEDRVLEVGVGTGRMARPLMVEGIRVTGLDISSEMMGQLQAQLTPEHTVPDLLLGDATALPFRDGSFRAVMAVHVFHLVASADAALAEVRRVLARGGILLHQTRRPTEETRQFWLDSWAHLQKLLKRRGYDLYRRDMPEVRQSLEASGGRLREIHVVRGGDYSTVAEEVERVKTRRQAWTWRVPEGMLEEAMPEYEAWLQERSGGAWQDDVMLTVEVWNWD